jgi:hypothetical protein
MMRGTTLNCLGRLSSFIHFASFIVGLTALACGLGCDSAWGQRPLQFRVASKPDTTHVYPESKEYVGILKNVGKSSVRLEGVEMYGEKSGGFMGAGRFFPCSIQTWSPGENRWRTVRSPQLTDYGAHQEPVSIEIAPGAELKVCGWLLPQQAGHKGDRARFLLRLTWSSKPESVASDLFTLGEDVDADQNSSSNLRDSATQPASSKPSRTGTRDCERGQTGSVVFAIDLTTQSPVFPL